MCCRAIAKSGAGRQARTAPVAQASGVEAGTAISSEAPSRPSSKAATRESTGNGAPLEQLPLPEGEQWDPVVGETAEMQANHFEWAHKRHVSDLPQHLARPALPSYVTVRRVLHWLLRRVKKFGPVFSSNIYGQDVVVVADFVGLQKVRHLPGISVWDVHTYLQTSTI